MNAVISTARLLFLPIIETSVIVKTCSAYYLKIQQSVIADISIRTLQTGVYAKAFHDIKNNPEPIKAKTEQELNQEKTSLYANLFFCFDFIRNLKHLPPTFQVVGSNAVFLADTFSLAASCMFLKLEIDVPEPLHLHKNPEKLLKILIHASWIASFAFSLLMHVVPVIFQTAAYIAAGSFGNIAIGFTISKYLYAGYQNRELITQTFKKYISQVEKQWAVLSGDGPNGLKRKFRAIILSK